MNISGTFRTNSKCGWERERKKKEKKHVVQFIIWLYPKRPPKTNVNVIQATEWDPNLCFVLLYLLLGWSELYIFRTGYICNGKVLPSYKCSLAVYTIYVCANGWASVCMLCFVVKRVFSVHVHSMLRILDPNKILPLQNGSREIMFRLLLLLFALTVLHHPSQ